MTSSSTVFSTSGIPNEHHSHHVEHLPPTHGYWYNVNDLDGGNQDFHSSYGTRTGNDQLTPYDAAYSEGALWNVDPVLPPSHVLTMPTIIYPSSAHSLLVNSIHYDPPPYSPSGIPFVSPSTLARVQELSETLVTFSGHELRCHWGTPACGQGLGDGSSATVRAHLRDAHGIGLGTGTHNAKRASAHCLWDGECSRTSELILVSGMGKHVATCHLKTTRLSCASCGQTFSRQDSLTRHAYLYCRTLKRVEGCSEGEPKPRRSQKALTMAAATAPHNGNFTRTSVGV
ncbi:hypothetical protein LXA43DRAFT_10353 [Ganoderma leucocontextum]|nr:hypothetical protein LXA43DRAFT_10353 [Ganoderma leucocontextum]